MYDNLSIPANTDVDALHWQMVMLLRLRPSLGFVLLVFQNDFYRNLIGKSTLCLRPESTPSYIRQGRSLLPPS